MADRNSTPKPITPRFDRLLLVCILSVLLCCCAACCDLSWLDRLSK